MQDRTIREGVAYEGRRGDLRCVVTVDGGYVEFTRRAWHDRRNAPDAVITLRAFKRWAVREASDAR